MAIEAPIGTSDFPTLRRLNGYYVDKTAFIIQLLGTITQTCCCPVPAASARH